jgi:hypothetical protein
MKAERMGERASIASLSVASIAVGHGDATLIKWKPVDGDPFTVLIDGGPRTGKRSKLARALNKADVHRIDVLLLTHCDADHVDGFVELWSERLTELPVGRYWGPCLPAFERHAWLFPPRIKRGLDQARALEDALSAAGVPVVYPMEHYVWRSPDGGLKIIVLSPASRLIKRLLIAADAEDLFLDYPTPLGWLLKPEEPEELVPEDAFGALRSLLHSRAFLSPGDISGAAPPTGTPEDRDSRARSWTEKTGQDPEFFGNHVLNDTSIVLLLEARCENAMRRLLFTGDLENFCYLASRHSLGLHCDVVKAPHHGSRSYLGRDTAIEDVWQWLRPHAVLVSANGKHGLPRTEFRDAALRWGATLFCTCRRSREIVVGAQPTGSCHDAFACKTQEDVVLEVSAASITSTGVACASGSTSVVQPLIQIRQHIIEPSNIIERFTENELLGHVEWLRRRLRAHHVERLAAQPDADAEPVTSETLTHDARSEGRHPAALNIDQVLDRGASDDKFWVSPRQYAGSARSAYVLPNSQERSALEKWIADFLLIQLAIDQDRWSRVRTLSELITAADTTTLATVAASHFRFPKSMFQSAIWPQLSSWLCTHRDAGLRPIGHYDQVILLFFSGTNVGDVVSKLFKRLSEYDSAQVYSKTAFPFAVSDVPQELQRIMTFPFLKDKNLAVSDFSSKLSSASKLLEFDPFVEYLQSHPEFKRLYCIMQWLKECRSAENSLSSRTDLSFNKKWIREQYFASCFDKKVADNRPLLERFILSCWPFLDCTLLKPDAREG